MKLGFITLNELAQIEADAQFAKDHGYVGLEINHWGTFADLTVETVEQIRVLLDRHGVECSTLGLWGWNHISSDPEERTRCHEALERAIGFAEMLGAPVLITGGGNIGEDDLGANVAEFAKVMPRFIDQAGEKGIRIALYGFHGGSFLSTVAAYEAVWEQVPNVGIKLDPANVDHAGEDYLAILRHHGERIYHVHLKEHLTHDGDLASQPAIGMGDIEWGKVMAFLYEAGYDQYLTVEPHGRLWARPPLREKMLKLSRKYIDQFLL